MTDEFNKECEKLFQDWRKLREDTRKAKEELEQRNRETERLKDKMKIMIMKGEQEGMRKHIADLQGQVRQLTEERNFEREENNRREQQREEERRHEFMQFRYLI